MKSHAIFAPPPDYSDEARTKRLTGSGVAVVDIDPSTGKVTRAVMAVSTGHDILDRASVTAFKAWRFVPNTVSKAKIPITYTMTGPGATELQVVKSRSMEELLASFLGKGNLLNGPVPKYPKFSPWPNKEGKGTYQIQFDKEGKVAEVRILKSSADAIFDREAVSTLHQWRLRKGPLLVQLPLAFKLTSDSYRVWIP